VLLFTTKLPNYFIFMLGCVFALVVNFPDPKEQEARLAAHAPKAISLVATVLMRPMIQWGRKLVFMTSFRDIPAS